MGRREKDIQLLVAKFIELVESLNPGERLSIKKVIPGKRGAAAKSQNRAGPAAKPRKTAKKPKSRR